MNELAVHIVVMIQALGSVVLCIAVLAKVIHFPTKANNDDQSLSLCTSIRLATVVFIDMDRKVLVICLLETALMVPFAFAFRQVPQDSTAAGVLLILQNLMLFGLAYTLLVIFFAALSVALIESKMSSKQGTGGRIVSVVSSSSDKVTSHQVRLQTVEFVMALCLLMLNCTTSAIQLTTGRYEYQALWFGIASTLLFLASFSTLYIWLKVNRTLHHAENEIAAGVVNQPTVVRHMRSQQLSQRMIGSFAMLFPIALGYVAVTVFTLLRPTTAKEPFAIGGNGVIPTVNALVIGGSVCSIQISQWMTIAQRRAVDAVISGDKIAPALKKSSKHQSSGHGHSQHAPQSPTALHMNFTDVRKSADNSQLSQ